MTCRRAFDADLLAVLRGEDGDADFVAHYPSCPECGAEVRVWEELDGMLRAGAPADRWHPSAEELVALVDRPATLAAETRAGIERHLATCVVCTDEAGTLRSFDFGRLAAASPAADDAAVARPLAAATAGGATRAPERVAAPAEHGARAPRGGWLGRVVWHPAFAYALVVVLLYPAWRGQFESLSPMEKKAPSAAAPAIDALAPAAPAGGAAPAEKPAPPPAVAQPAAESASRRNAAPAAAPPAEPAPAPGAALELAQRLRAQDDGGAMARKGERAAAVRESEEEYAKMEDDAAGAPHLSDLAGTLVRAEQGASSARPDAASVVDIKPGAHAAISFADAERGPFLRIESPAAIADGAVEVRVQSATGARELAQRATPRANAIELQIPPRWLTPGEWVVTVAATGTASSRSRDEAARAGAAATLGFSVRAPIAAKAAR